LLDDAQRRFGQDRRPCEALKKSHGRQHIVIDPAQHASGPEAVDSHGLWMPRGVGLHNLQRAGFDDLIEFYKEPCYRVLARLETNNRIVDFAFIDGWTTFDYKLADYFLTDKLLRVGGIVVVRTGWTRAGMHVCRYVSSNLAYRPCGRIPDEPAADPADDALGLANGMVAFRKEHEDTRRWKHHVEF
jgi:Methyltransferase domain